MTPHEEEPEGRTAPAHRARTTGAALESHYRFILWLVPAVERFPRSRKFLLGDRIQNTALDVLERLIEATYTRRRSGHLAVANLGLEKLRFLFRLAWDLRVLDRRRYEYAARCIDETGRKVGAWRKVHSARESAQSVDRIASFEALHAAALRAARAKRGKPGVAAFLANLETEVLRLERELKSGLYCPGRYTKIEIHDPKHRIVSAAPFRDRVVHHAFCAVCEPIFERGFIHDSYANRVGKGTHRAVARYEKFRDRSRYVLRCDIFRYFHTIDHEILKRDLRRRLACERTLDLADRIIDGSNPQEPVYQHFPGDVGTNEVPGLRAAARRPSALARGQRPTIPQPAPRPARPLAARDGGRRRSAPTSPVLDCPRRARGHLASASNDLPRRVVRPGAGAWPSPRRVLRGGSWNNKPRNLRSANRNRNTTDNRNNNNGFRVARTLNSRSRRRHGSAGSAVSVQGGS